MTLPELLISVVVIGLVATILSVAVTVTLRTKTDTQARFDVARWEQNLAAWLPNDLTSATVFDKLPTATPCGTRSDCSVLGLNALMLSWTDAGAQTVVSYRYQPAADGATYELHRVACVDNAPCSSVRVLGDLAAPPSSTEVPPEVIEITVPDDLSAEEAAQLATGDRMIKVTVNGIPTQDGVDRSARISLAAGGATIGTVPIPQYAPPGSTAARSDCGGPVTLIVDRSGSIGADIVDVRRGVAEFVKVFAGTATQLQIVDFANTSSALGAGPGSWNKYWDLTERSQVETLIGPNGDAGLVAGLTAPSSGNTNWEDALFRTFYTRSGARHDGVADPEAPMPELVVFFTDGLPTRDRAELKSDDASTALGTPVDARFAHTRTYDASLPSNQRPFSPRGWFRANVIVEDFRDEARIIGLGVGAAFGNQRYIRTSNVAGAPFVAGWPQLPTPHSTFLGTLVGGGDPSVRTPDGGEPAYVTRTYNDDDQWGGSLDNVDMLVATDLNHFAGALAKIALAECGGTLTLQTRVSGAETPAQTLVTYEIAQPPAPPQTITTSRIVKSGTANVSFAGQSSQAVTVTPQALDGLRADGWSCRAGGAAMTPGVDYQLVEPGDGAGVPPNPVAGITVVIAANKAVSCTLHVSPV